MAATGVAGSLMWSCESSTFGGVIFAANLPTALGDWIGAVKRPESPLTMRGLGVEAFGLCEK